MSSVLITGGSGLIGRALVDHLMKRGHVVSVLSRRKQIIPNTKSYVWDYENNQIDEQALENIDTIIHLAGAGVAEKRWTPKRKSEIIQSRVQTTRLLLDSISKMDRKPTTFISASAVGFYGSHKTDKVFSEEDTPGQDFLADTCVQWEEEVKKFDDIGIRTAIVRTGVVLTKRGGALSKMMAPMQAGIVSALGSGRQQLAWIHIQDLCAIYSKLLEEEHLKGVFNAVAPEQVNNKEFTLKLANVLNKSFVLPNTPSFLMKLLFGEMAVVLLNGNAVSSDKIQSQNFRFQFPKLEPALRDLLTE